MMVRNAFPWGLLMPSLNKGNWIVQPKKLPILSRESYQTKLMAYHGTKNLKIISFLWEREISWITSYSQRIYCCVKSSRVFRYSGMKQPWTDQKLDWGLGSWMAQSCQAMKRLLRSFWNHPQPFKIISGLTHSLPALYNCPALESWCLKLVMSHYVDCVQNTHFSTMLVNVSEKKFSGKMSVENVALYTVKLCALLHYILKSLI